MESRKDFEWVVAPSIEIGSPVAFCFTCSGGFDCEGFKCKSFEVEEL